MTTEAEKLKDEILRSGELTPEFINQHEQTLFAEAMLGEEAINFLNSDLGKVLRGYALQQMAECKNELLRTPWWRFLKIQRLQFEARVAEQFLRFIAEALTNGESAYQQLKEMRTKE